jgi:hypothetical protein
MNYRRDYSIVEGEANRPGLFEQEADKNTHKIVNWVLKKIINVTQGR